MFSKIANNPLSLVSASDLIIKLRDFSKKFLPEIMVPTRFVILDELPKLPNGKVDRKQLLFMDVESTSSKKYKTPSSPEELRITEIWCDLLRLSRVSIDDSFFDLGGDSLSVVQMIAKIRDEYSVALSLRQFFKNPTVESLAQMINAKSRRVITGGLRNLSDEELLNEAQLPLDVAPDEAAMPLQHTPYQKILLTGGTGYTGAFLLKELLDRSAAQLYVLVRAKSVVDALDRIRTNMLEYDLWHNSYVSRIKGIPADIGRPYFGVTPEVYQELTEQIEMIVHNAALSSYAMPYWQLKPINVLGTLEVLRLACRKRIKAVHYVSSLAVFPAYKGHRSYEETELSEPQGLVGGYRQSKWVADKLVSQAGHRGLPICIYRPGQITGAQDTGACSTDTFLNAAIKGCIQLQSELDFDVLLEITPVDFCAASIAHIALSAAQHGMQFHLTSARSVHWRDVMSMVRRYGYQLDTVEYKTWYQRLAVALEKNEDNALRKFFLLFGEETPSGDAGDESSLPLFKSDNLQAAIKNMNITCKELNQDLMKRYLDYFVSTGYLDAPSLTNNQEKSSDKHKTKCTIE